MNRNLSNLCGLPPLIFLIFTLSACSTIATNIPDRSINIGGIFLAANTRRPADSSRSDVIIKASKLVQNATFYLKTGSHNLCGTYVTYDAGLSYLDISMLEKIGLQDSSIPFGASSNLSVFHVVPDSAADLAGVQDGDIIEDVSVEEAAENPQEKTSLKIALDQAVKSGKPFNLTLRRGQDQIQTEIEPEAACDFQVAVKVQGEACCSIYVWREHDQYKEPIWYSFEDDDKLDSMQTKRTLALYISHNAAHALMGHHAKLARSQNTAATVGVPSAVSIFGSNPNVGPLTSPFKQQTENEMRNVFEPKADFLSLYMLAESGYGTDVAVSLLRKLVSPKGAPNFPQIHVFTEPGESWRNFAQPYSEPHEPRTKPLNKASRLTQNRYSKIQIEASAIDEKLKNKIPLREGVTSINQIIGEIDSTRIPAPDPADGPPKPTTNIIFGDPYFH